MANIALQRTFMTLMALYPEKYKYAEDFIRDFGTSDSTRNHAWSVAPSKLFGPLPEELMDICPSYSKACTVFKKHGQEGVDKLTSGLWQEFNNNYVLLMRNDAVANFKNITGLEPNNAALRSIQVWKKFKRGKDLFIKGLGNFDIKAAVQAIIDRDGYGYWKSNHTPYCIQCQGYFGTTEHVLVELLPDLKHPVMQHVIRYRQQWTIELLGRLDEVLSTYRLDGPIPNMHRLTPNQVLTIAETNSATRRAASDRNLTSMEPFALTGITNLELDGYILSQVECPNELKCAGIYLNNCLDGFRSNIRTGMDQIWCLYKDRDLIGAGQLRLQGHSKHTWMQIRGKGNGRLATEQSAVYAQALPIIIESL